jgi:hypothetical protein
VGQQRPRARRSVESVLPPITAMTLLAANGRDVPGTDSCTATSEAYWSATQSPRRRRQAVHAAP